MDFRRRPVAAPARARAHSTTLPAPVRGWISATNRAAPPKQAAKRLRNWFPTTTGIRLGGTSTLKATIGSNAVESLFVYDNGSTRKLFAADETKVFDVTTPADPGVAPSAEFSGQTSGYYSAVPMTTSGGSFLTIFNGDDTPYQFDGSSWTNPSITGVTSSTLIQGWVYRNRMYMVQAGSQSAWYLGVGAKSGAATEISLTGVFKRGGTLLFGATWSLDAGDGVDDKCVFVSSEGEVAVYEGSYPGGSDWNLVGRYDMAPPLGKNASLQIGGDLLILTEAGMIPISAVISKDPAALALAAVSRNIEPDWRREVIARRSLPWEVVKWPSHNMILVSLPVTGAGDEDLCFPVNSETGAWCEYTWNTRSLAIFDEWLYFGTNDGTIHQAEIGGDHSGENVYHAYVGHAEHLGSIGAYKTVKQARAIFVSSVPFTPKLSVSLNYQENLPSYPNAADTGEGDEWDVGTWDNAKWDQSSLASVVNTRFVSIGQSGYAIHPQIQVTSGSDRTPDTELTAFDLIYDVGGVVV